MRQMNWKRGRARALGLAALGLACVGGTSFRTAAASEELSEEFREIDYQDPLTAAPPVTRPSTRSCTVRLMEERPFIGFTPFEADYTPPADCPGPWSKIVLDWDAHVAGVQFDRLAGVWFGGVEVLRTTTPEPTAAGIRWHIEKDLSPYAPVLAEPQHVVVDMGNVVDSTYTGIIYLTLDVTFYASDRHHRPAAHPDQIVAISREPVVSPWYHTPSEPATKTVTLPTNIKRALLEVYASPHGNEEFWYARRPSFRELQVLVDGDLAGIATPFPAIYTGGLNPLLWRPIPGVEAFDVAPYVVDLTPFAGVLSDGQPHSISMHIANNTDYWPVDGNLLLDLDAAPTVSGGILRNTIQPDAEVTVESTTVDGVLHVATRGSRSWLVEGYVDTAAGRTVTTVSQDASFANDIDSASTLLVVHQTQHTATTTSVSARHGRARVTRVVDDYPLEIDLRVTARIRPEDGHNIEDRRSSIDVALNRSTSSADHEGEDGDRASRLGDALSTRALWFRDLSAGGRTVASDTVQTEIYQTRSSGRCLYHRLHTLHGFVTEDELRSRCGHEDDDSERGD